MRRWKIELESAKEAASIYFIPSLDRAQAKEEDAKPESDQHWTRRRFLSNATVTAVFFALALDPRRKPKLLVKSGANQQARHDIFSDERLWLSELDTAIDDCLEACAIGDVLSIITACTRCKANEEIDLHTLAQSTSPRMRATLQNLADILIMQPHLAGRGCAVLREKIERKSPIDFRRLLVSMIPADDDPMLSTLRVANPCRAFLEDEVHENLVSDATKSRIMQRRDRMIGHLVTKK